VSARDSRDVTTLDRVRINHEAIAMKSFADTAREFRTFHNNSFNVALHLVTTPACLSCVVAGIQLRFGDAWVRNIFWAYGFAVTLLTPGYGLKLSTTLVWCAIVRVALIMATVCDMKTLGVIFASAYVGQELAHLVTGEKTYQASYMDASNWPSLLVEHTFYLLPLCLDAVMHMRESFLSWIIAHNYVVRAKLTSAKEKASLKVIENFVTDEDPDRTCTAHWWHELLPPKEKKAFTDIVHAAPIQKMFADRFRPDAWAVDPIYGMNEIYVASSHHNNNSDTVFYMEHCDGPWSVYPFCFVYRCMLAVNENVQVETNFCHEGTGGCLSDGDIVGFDYHREIHVIADRPTPNKDRRVTMKLHYVVYPKCFGPFGRFLGTLAMVYNTAARRLFLNTIRPTGFWRFMAWMVLTVTNAVFNLEKYAGLNNVMSAVALYAIGQFIHPYFFMAVTSFTHYSMYIATYHCRGNINFGVFKRNVIFWKTLALSHLGYNYYMNFEFDPISLAMLVGGYGLSAAAANALGIDQTYFGVELGKVEPNFVSCFPYNTIPHPMIIGSMVGLLGFHKMAGFRAALPYLIPAHCAFYMVHMIQEQVNDIYANVADEKTKVVVTKKATSTPRKAASAKKTPSAKASPRTPKKTPSKSASRTPKKTPSRTPSRSRARR